MTTPTLATAGSAATITLMVTMTLKPEHEAAFLDDAREFVRKVHANEARTLTFALNKHPTLEHTYVWVERYEDAAAFEVHRGMEYMQADRPWRQERLAKPTEVLRLSQVAPE